MKRIIKRLKKSKKTVLESNKQMEFNHIHHVSESYLNSFYLNYSPVFVLNTGRSGSAFIQTVFNQFVNVDSYHEASPNLFSLSNFAFTNQNDSETLKKIFEAARIELLLQASIKEKIYIESNQCLVFYIHQIKQLFPNAKFIHLTRHPGDFVRSAIMKGWHKNDSIWEKGRIKRDETDTWNRYSQIEKLSWVWNETHQFIENFKAIHSDSFLTLRLEDLVKDTKLLKSMLDFVGAKNNLLDNQIADLLTKKVNKVTVSKNEPSNMFKLNDYAKYESWSLNDKDELKSIVGDLALKYNYDL